MADEKKDVILKRIHLDYELNYLLTERAKAFGQNHHEFVNDAVRHYIEFMDGNMQSDDIYTRRISELTEAVNALRVEDANMREGVYNRLDTIALFNSDSNYLEDK